MITIPLQPQHLCRVTFSDGKKTREFPFDRPHRPDEPMPYRTKQGFHLHPDITEWIEDQIFGKWSVSLQERRPNPNEDLELEKISLYANLALITGGSYDTSTPEGITIHFADEADAVHFKMRWWN